MTTETKDLLENALKGKYEDDEPWDAVATLRSNGSREIFEVSVNWLSSDDPLKRARGADILAQLREASFDNDILQKPRWLFRDESYQLLSEMLEHESNDLVVDSIIAALGHLDNEAGVPLIARHATHANRNIRFSVACALGNYPNHPLAIKTLIPLTRDNDNDVRDWSTFGLGVLGESDSQEIREALLSRLGDSDEDTREEAMVALAKRKDLRMLALLQNILSSPEWHPRAAEAASALLNLPREPEGWKSDDYLKALEEEFGS